MEYILYIVYYKYTYHYSGASICLTVRVQTLGGGAQEA